MPVSVEETQGLIRSEECFVCRSGMTIVALTTRQGFTAVGTAATIDGLGDRSVGRKIARDKAFAQLVAREAYRKMYEARNG